MCRLSFQCVQFCVILQNFTAAANWTVLCINLFFPHPKVWRRTWKSVLQICLWTPVASDALGSQGHTAWSAEVILGMWATFLQVQYYFSSCDQVLVEDDRWMRNMAESTESEHLTCWVVLQASLISLTLCGQKSTQLHLPFRSAFIHFPEVWIFFPLSPCRQAAKMILALLVFACWAAKPTEF